MADRINLTWALPVIGPLVVIIAMRVLWLFAGAPWSVPESYALLALLLGSAGGVIAIAADAELTIRKWWVK